MTLNQTTGDSQLSDLLAQAQELIELADRVLARNCSKIAERQLNQLRRVAHTRNKICNQLGESGERRFPHTPVDLPLLSAAFASQSAFRAPGGIKYQGRPQERWNRALASPAADLRRSRPQAWRWRPIARGSSCHIAPAAPYLGNPG
jgi:hypothetical protein